MSPVKLVSTGAPEPRMRAEPGFLFLAPLLLALLLAPRQDYVGLEALLTLVTAAICYVYARTGSKSPVRLPALPVWAVILLPGLFSIALRVALLPWIPKPEPVVSDEFSHRF